MSELDNSLDYLKDTYNYNHWIYSMLRPWLGEKVLEVGSGTGNISRFLLDRNVLVCVEPCGDYLPGLHKLAEVHSNINVVAGDDGALDSIIERADLYDSVVCLNVLEHIEDHKKAVERFERILKSGGRLLLYVPACSWAFGKIDRKLGHFRRYNRKHLLKLVADSGFHIKKCRYVNFVGVWGWWWSSRILGEPGIKKNKAHFVDRLVPYISAIERLVPPPVGQSLFVVGEKV